METGSRCAERMGCNGLVSIWCTGSRTCENHEGDALRILPIGGNSGIRARRWRGADGRSKHLNRVREYQYENGAISAEQAVLLVQEMAGEQADPEHPV